ncbi:MAG: pilus assembly protein PilM [Cellulosilyticum sp.]|nr:pilus assembly protein PilM [Cellulosilyticum sp.]
MNTRILGIEIGTAMIKIVEVSKYRGKLMVQKYSLIETPGQCICNGIISKIGPIQEIIANELKKQKYHAHKVIVVIQSKEVIVRHVLVNHQSEKIIRQILAIKMEEFLPINRKEYQVDFKVIAQIKDDENIKSKIRLVAAPNKLVLPIVELMKNLKLKLIGITAASEGIENIIRQEQEQRENQLDQVMILDIGGYSTALTMLDKDGELYTHIIDYGMAHTWQLIESIGYSKEEVTEEILLRGILPQVEYHILSAIESILRFYNTKHQMRQMDKIYLIGGGAEIKGLRSYIRDALNVPTEKMNQLETVMIAPGVQFETNIRFFVNILGGISAL